jgi:hypothetical protein
MFPSRIDIDCSVVTASLNKRWLSAFGINIRHPIVLETMKQMSNFESLMLRVYDDFIPCSVLLGFVLWNSKTRAMVAIILTEICVTDTFCVCLVCITFIIYIQF